MRGFGILWLWRAFQMYGVAATPALGIHINFSEGHIGPRFIGLENCVDPFLLVRRKPSSENRLS